MVLVEQALQAAGFVCPPGTSGTVPNQRSAAFSDPAIDTLYNKSSPHWPVRLMSEVAG